MIERILQDIQIGLWGKTKWRLKKMADNLKCKAFMEFGPGIKPRLILSEKFIDVKMNGRLVGKVLEADMAKCVIKLEIFDKAVQKQIKEGCLSGISILCNFASAIKEGKQ